MARQYLIFDRKALKQTNKDKIRSLGIRTPFDRYADRFYLLQINVAFNVDLIPTDTIYDIRSEDVEQLVICAR